MWLLLDLGKVSSVEKLVSYVDSTIETSTTLVSVANQEKTLVTECGCKIVEKMLLWFFWYNLVDGDKKHI